MRTILFITLILTLTLGFSCKDNSKQKDNDSTEIYKKETNPSTVNLNTTFTTTIHAKNGGDNHYAESTFNNKLLKDATINYSDNNYYEIYITLHGFEKEITHTLSQQDFEKFLTDSSPVRRNNVNNIKLTVMSTDLESGIVNLRYEVDNEDLIHMVDYQLLINDNRITDKKLIHIKTNKKGDTKVSISDSDNE